jgi:hypothetical protein
MQLIIGAVFAIVIGMLSLLFVDMPDDFALGFLFGVAIYQIAHYFKHRSFLGG